MHTSTVDELDAALCQAIYVALAEEVDEGRKMLLAVLTTFGWRSAEFNKRSPPSTRSAKSSAALRNRLLSAR